MSAPILIYSPAGGVSTGPISNPPVYSQADVTQLIEGQAYIDVVFGSIQTDDSWVLVACEVENTVDFEPLNIWPGIITNRTTTGFRLQLNGMPDSNNYFLNWAVSGVNIAPSPASTYLLSGPTSGSFGVAVTYTVALPGSTTLSAPVIVTPSDGGAGGVFSPTIVTLTTGTPSASFTYTPASYGAITISTTNTGALTNPANIVLTVAAATGYSMTGPSAGLVSVASTNFTVTLTPGGLGVPAPVTVTPSDSSGGGSFTPSTVSLSTGTPSATFTYTPGSIGTKTISATNSGGLTDPGSLSYTVTAPALSFNDTFTGSGALSAHTADTGQTWVLLITGGTFNAIVSGGDLIQSSVIGSPELISTYTPATADTEATITVVKGSITGAPEVGIWLRATPDATNPRGYMGRFVEGTGWQFYRIDAGITYVQLGSNVAGTLATGDTIRFTIAGTGATITLTLYKNGASVATASDTSGNRITTTGKIGIHLYDPSGGVSDYQVNQITSP